MAEVKTPKTQTGTAAKRAEHEKRVAEYNAEKIPVIIPRPTDEVEDSVTITLNGKNYQIQYDAEVMIPRSVALIVEESLKNKREADAIARARAGSRPLSGI